MGRRRSKALGEVKRQAGGKNHLRLYRHDIMFLFSPNYNRSHQKILSGTMTRLYLHLKKLIWGCS